MRLDMTIAGCSFAGLFTAPGVSACGDLARAAGTAVHASLVFHP